MSGFEPHQVKKWIKPGLRMSSHMYSDSTTLFEEEAHFLFYFFFFALVFKGRSKAPKQVRVDLGLETLSDMGSALQAIKRYLSSQKERNLRHTLLSVFLLASFNSSQLSLTVCSEFLSEASHSPRGRDLRH